MASWKKIVRGDDEITRAMKVPGGMVIAHTEFGDVEGLPYAVSMVFVPCSPNEADAFMGVAK